MKIKLCGFKNQKSVLKAIDKGVNFIGFVFCEKSVRYITPEKASEVAKIIPPSIAKVAVLSDNSLDDIKKIHQNLNPDYFQFHGGETLAFVRQIKEIFSKVKIIKAFSIGDKEDLNQIKEFENDADLFLFDSKKISADGASGGTGEVFDWNILLDLECKKDWFLSGGLNVDNVIQAAKRTGAKMMDISSGIEEVRGEKSVKLIEELMKKVTVLH